MIDILLSHLDRKSSPDKQIHQLREQLQLLILKIMSDHKAFVHLSFLGGTALRICHHIQRYSEDLDFSLIRKEGYDFITMIQTLHQELEKYGFTINIKYKQGIIDSVSIRFANILQQAKLSPLTNQEISIKIEIDTNPPTGYRLTTTILNNIFMFPISVFDLPSLFAGKLHAILYRPFVKGRDRYDLVWYLSNHIQPNLTLLQRAEQQNNITSLTKNISDLKMKILSKIEHITTQQLLDDVGPFLLDPYHQSLLHIDTIKPLIQAL